MSKQSEGDKLFRAELYSLSHPDDGPRCENILQCKLFLKEDEAVNWCEEQCGHGFEENDLRWRVIKR